MTRRLNDVTPEEWDATRQPGPWTALEFKAMSESFDDLSKQFSPLNSLKPEYVVVHTVDGTVAISRQTFMKFVGKYKERQFKGLSEASEDFWDDKDEDRINVIGQNGNDGEHYKLRTYEEIRKSVDNTQKFIDSLRNKYLTANNAAMDNVSKPKHYKILDSEAIDMIADTLTQDEFRGYCLGNILKYRLRAGKKGDALEDLAKADEYEKIYARYYGENND